MFKVGTDVVCVYGKGNLKTQHTYKVVEVNADGERIVVEDSTGRIVLGTYTHKSFMSKDSMVKQVLENARND